MVQKFAKLRTYGFYSIVVCISRRHVMGWLSWVVFVLSIMGYPFVFHYKICNCLQYLVNLINNNPINSDEINGLFDKSATSTQGGPRVKIKHWFAVYTWQ